MAMEREGGIPGCCGREEDAGIRVKGMLRIGQVGGTSKSSINSPREWLGTPTMSGIPQSVQQNFVQMHLFGVEYLRSPFLDDLNCRQRTPEIVGRCWELCDLSDTPTWDLPDFVIVMAEIPARLAVRTKQLIENLSKSITCLDETVEEKLKRAPGAVSHGIWGGTCVKGREQPSVADIK